MPSPKGRSSRRYIVGVSGGIAAYKACELVRLLVKSGAEVRVVMTKNAEAFVGALTFASLSGHPVLRSLDSLSGYDLSATAHIDLAQWGDAFLVAPATANTLAKIANGIADDALTTEALAFTGPVLLAPAMNTRMWEAAATRANMNLLRERGFNFVGPIEGELACGESGIGKMAEPQEIFARSQALFGLRALAGKKVLITSGPTRAYLDAVRFLTNRSSGKMGYALATAASALGAEVTFVTGPAENMPVGAKIVAVETTQEMEKAALAAVGEADIIIAAAAVVDFEADVQPGKIERKGNLSLEMRASTDVIASLARARRPGQVFVAFAAETGPREEQATRARAKLEKKGVDFVALNDVGRSDIGFDQEMNELRVFSRDGDGETTFAKAPKIEIARALLLHAMGSGK